MRSLSRSAWRAGSMPSTRTVSPIGLVQALEDLDRRRLARAVGPQQAEDLARVDLEADAVDGLDVAVALVQVGDRDDRDIGAVAHDDPRGTLRGRQVA